MDPQTQRLLERLRLRNLALTAELRARLSRQLTARWRSMESWRDADIVKLENAILPLMSAAERQMADLTNAYLASALSAGSGDAFRPASVNYKAVTGEALRGISPVDVFRRPQMVLNYQLSKGASLTQAVTAGEKRLQSLGMTNLQLAKTRTAASQSTDGWFRRVLTGSENCAMCVIASTQRYRSNILQPIHPGCDCGVEPLLGQPPLVIAPELLETTHASIEQKLGVTDRNAFSLALEDIKTDSQGRRISDFTDLIVTREHGELGPVLTWRNDRFRTPAQARDLAH